MTKETQVKKRKRGGGVEMKSRDLQQQCEENELLVLREPLREPRGSHSTLESNNRQG